MSSDVAHFSHLVNGLPLGTYQRDVIMSRYVPLMIGAEHAYARSCAAYITSTLIITVASVVIVALIPLDKMAGLNTSVIFWINFSFSVALALANKFMHAFSVGQKYIFRKIYLEKLRSEGWAFVSGTDKYSGIDIDTRFTLFCSRIEHLKIKSLEIESTGSSPNDMIAAGPADAHTDVPADIPADVPADTPTDIPAVPATTAINSNNDEIINIDNEVDRDNIDIFTTKK